MKQTLKIKIQKKEKEKLKADVYKKGNIITFKAAIPK